MKRTLVGIGVLLMLALLIGCSADALKSPSGAPAGAPPAGSSADPASPASTPEGVQNKSPAPSAPAPAAPGGGGQSKPPAQPAPADMEARLVVPAEATAGQPVDLTLEITNRVAAMTATYSSGQMYDFWVEQNGREVWRWSRGRMFTQALVHRTISAGETLRFTVQWDGKDAQGKPAAPGTYTVHGRWLARTELASTPQAAPVSLLLK
ncbi:MAG: BsuPI-related putative proteinase inhibitor [Bacillota bacterium]